MSSIDPVPDSENSEEDKPATTFAFDPMSLPQANPATVVNPEGQNSGSHTVIADTGTAASVWNRLFPAAVVSESGVQQTIPDPKGITLDHFVLEERIGIGGMGSVFRAIDERLERVVALKILSPTQAADAGAVMRFRNEAKAAAKLDHDNISRVFYIGEDSGLNFIAFEYVTGTNVRDLIRKYGQLDPAEAINYVLQIAYALKHTSAVGVVHRDIKPSNIIITTSGRAKLVDLGLARKQNADSLNELTVAGTTLGTFDYISPEQAKDPRNVDVRSDIYSLGCTFYHMVTGSAPYPDGTMMQKLLSHREKDPPNPADKNKRVTPGLASIIQRMMASEPRNRFNTADELIHALLLAAGSYGMKGVNPEGLIWKPSQTTVRQFWERNLGWFTTVALLFIIVFSINGFQPEDDVPQAPNTKSPTTITDNNELNLPDDKEAISSNSIKPADKENEGNLLTTKDSEEKLFPGNADPDKVFNKDSSFTDEIVKSDTNEEKIIPEPAPEEEIEKTVIPPPVKPQVATKEEPRITLVSGTGANPQDYPTVESALAAAEDGSTIVLLYNGTISDKPEKFWKINNKSVTIKAGENQQGVSYQPVIRFDADKLQSDDSRFISIFGGSLELVNVDLSFDINGNTTQSDWNLFSLNGPDQLRLREVSVVVRNPRLQDVSLVSLIQQQSRIQEIQANPGQKPSLNSLYIRFNKCFITGQCQLIKSQHLIPGQVSARNNIFASWQVDQPLVSMTGNNTREEFQAMLEWIGEKNFYENFMYFRSIQPKQVSEKTENLTFANWKLLPSGTISSSVVDQIVWRNDWKQKEVLEIRASDLELGKGVQGTELSTSPWQATDQGNVGADLIDFFTMPYNPEEEIRYKESRRKKLQGDFY